MTPRQTDQIPALRQQVVSAAKQTPVGKAVYEKALQLQKEAEGADSGGSGSAVVVDPDTALEQLVDAFLYRSVKGAMRLTGRTIFMMRKDPDLHVALWAADRHKYLAEMLRLYPAIYVVSSVQHQDEELVLDTGAYGTGVRNSNVSKGTPTAIFISHGNRDADHFGGHARYECVGAQA